MIKMIRDGYYCIYKEKEYELNEDINDNLIILKEDSSKIDLTFIDEYNSSTISTWHTGTSLQDYEVTI